MTNAELLDLARGLNDRREPYALVTVVRAVAPTSAYLGAQAIVLADGTLHGWIGGGCARGVVIAAAQSAIRAGEPKLVRISNDRLHPEEAVEQHTMSCASNGTIELFVQPYGSGAALCVLGDTPAAEEARFLADRLGIRLGDAPDEVRVVLVATQGQGDEDALEAALKGSAAHVLMIASRRKAGRLREVMRMRGVDDTRLARLVAPAGPDAGAKAPAEIALVAIVGVLAILRGRAPLPATERTGPAMPQSATSPVHPPLVTESLSAPPQREAAAPAEIGGATSPRTGAAAPSAKFINPVCGIAVDIAAPKHIERHEGVAYYFCCDCCLTTFRQDPAKYAAIHRLSAGAVSA
jgi:xanthine dehydrogenase accessory factor